MAAEAKRVNIYILVQPSERERERGRERGERERVCQIAVRICYHQCVFATVANTHSAYLLPQMRICYCSKYSNKYILPLRLPKI